MLSPEIQAEILSLHYGRKKGLRSIARELGLNRKSVRAVIERRGVALSPLSSPRGSILDPFKTEALELLKREPTIPASVILQRLREAGYLGGYSILKDWLATQRKAPRRAREAFLRLEFAPGECAQIDWGEFGDVFGDGVKIHCFLMVLCHSRLLYCEFTRSEKFEEFIRCHENAFRYFGGLVPLECWYDNLATAVTDRMGSLIRFNAKFMAYMGHHGIRAHACNPARGNEKGRVEDGVKYVRSSFWPGRKFTDFDDLCRQAAVWRDEIANKREHRSTRKTPALLFETEDKPAMQGMNPHSYDCDEVFSRVVSPNFHILYDTNRYSVPWTMVGMAVTVRVGRTQLNIFYNERFLCRHDRSYRKHQSFTNPSHGQGLMDRKPGGTRDGWQMTAVKSLGPAMKNYLELLRSGQRSLRTEVAKILALATVYGEAEVSAAAEELQKAGIVGVASLELSLKNRLHPSEHALSPHPLQFKNAKLNRVVPTVDLRRYDALLFESTQPPNASTKPGESHANNDTLELFGE